MVAIGYSLSSEEHKPQDLVRYAQQAEESGFSFALISDHFHPWIDQQGQSSFVWTVIGAIAQATEHLQLGTGITCPTIRLHPAIIAQAATTSAAMMPGRFFLGVGTGENLNEHILGDHWPAYEQRADMLREAIELIQLLWQGETTTYYGDYYVVENARIYTLPEQLPPIMVAAGGPISAKLAGEMGDGLISTSPDSELVDRFNEHGNANRPRYGQLTVCCHDDADCAREIAHKWWPNAGLNGQLSQELATPALFEQAVQNVSEADVAERVVCGNNLDDHLTRIQAYINAGFDHIYIHQVGPDQDAFFRFYQDHVLPELMLRR